MLLKPHLVLVLTAVAYQDSPAGKMIQKNDFVSGTIKVSRVNGAACYRDSCDCFRKLIFFLLVSEVSRGLAPYTY